MAKKVINSDIYNLAELIDDVKKTFIPDETDETLAIGTYGYIGALESHRLQTQVQMTGELANEIFPSRARLERNIITYAIMADISDINATPAKMTVYIQIKENDIIDNLNENNEFIIDRECPIYIGDYEFHLEYDIIIKQIYLREKNSNTYSAMYDMPQYREVPTSTTTSGNRYLSPPAVVNLNNEYYVYVTATIAQVSHTSLTKKLITSNIIENKTLTFDFTDQLAYFEVEVDEQDGLKYLQPVFEGSSVPDNSYQYYCWYQYIDTNIIRIRFDRNSYMPGLNATVNCLIKTTTGTGGNFNYTDDIQMDLTSSNYGYKNISAILVPLTNSANGKDRKSKSELQKLIPKENLARGSLTTITDLNNYFSTLDTEDGRIIIQKKIDNQIERVYYAYLVAKDTNGNILPSNTIDLKVGLEDLKRYRMTESKTDRFVLSSGTCIVLGNDGVGYINHDPVPYLSETLTTNAWARGKLVTVDFQVKVNGEVEDNNISVGASVNGAYTPTYVWPGNYTIYGTSNNSVIEAEDYMLLSSGQKYLFTGEFTTRQDTTNIEFLATDLDCFDFVEGYYQIGNNNPVTMDKFPIVIDGQEANTKINIGVTYMLNNKTNRTTVFKRDSFTVNKQGSATSFDMDDISADLGIKSFIIGVETSNPEIFAVIEEGTYDWRVDLLQPTFDTTETITVRTDYGIYNIEVFQRDNIIDLDLKMREYNGNGTIEDNSIIINGEVTDNNLKVLDEDAEVIRRKLILSALESSCSYKCYIPSITQLDYPVALEEGTIINYRVSYISPSKVISPEIVFTLSKGLDYVPFSTYVTYEGGTKTVNIEPTESDIKDNRFLYTNPYAISINGYSLYSAFYMMSMEENPFIYFEYINQKSNVQFIGSNVYWNRPFLNNKMEYTLKVSILQSVTEDLGVVPKSGDPLVKCIAVFYRDGAPYRYRTMRMTSYDSSTLSFSFEQTFISDDILDNDNNIKVYGVQAPGQVETGIFTVNFSGNEREFQLDTDCTNVWTLGEFLSLFGITGYTSVDSYEVTDSSVFEIEEGDEEKKTETKIYLRKVFDTDQILKFTIDGKDYTITASKYFLEYGYFNPTTDVKIYVICGVPDIDGNYSKYNLESICPLVDKNWTVTNIYNIVNGVTMYHNYSEIMGSRVVPYGDSHEDENGNTVMNLQGYYVYGVPMLGYNYCTDDTLTQSAIDGLNYRKGYIDSVLELLENSFGIDFKLFNTYGPSKTYYIIRDANNDGQLTEEKEYIDRVDLTFYFRVKLSSDKDSYTKNNIVNEIKDYLEDLDDIGELHIPNLITQITTNYQEQIDYFEYLGFNSYGPEVQHIYKDDDDIIDIHDAPEFINVANVSDGEGGVTPAINVYVSEI